MTWTADDFEALRPMGWRDDAPAALALAGRPKAALARVVGQHRNAYVVATTLDEARRVQPPAAWTRPRFRAEDRAVVGDWVLLDAKGEAIATLLPRHALLRRAAAGEHYQQQPIAANIDFVLVVTGLDGDFNPRRIERYLLLVQASGAAPVLVLTKADLAGEAASEAADLLQPLVDAGFPLHVLNGKDAASAAVLAPYLGPGRSCVLVGSSGAGKSTLTNTLLGRETMKTAEVRETDSRGRHTTTSRVLIPLPLGACLIDTPGMRELKLIGEEDLADKVFEDIEALASQCRFRDCAHLNEPGCAVLAALDSGELEETRWAHYMKLRDERDAAATTLAARRQEARQAPKGTARKPGGKDKFGRR
ncbi:ribosome small subunit-dependent GTPase A [Silanimonas sp.]|uniref:ribosome small subunit-dependent GTPase A n=1 Tax=Silanimonas sp. TaxID=1929290 RepID=UPI001BBD8018|nr:ribosome small subunit-dependent GTPase A [Silanimonas sp.]MBS3895200.1 ribosome small subunit-dependent GTPase A [Silanimonas sp.]MBS3925013.1 ribosome small subunit-dependent GTPase A [Xanthomonadaceae bacterium]